MKIDATALHPGLLEPPLSKSDAHRALAFAWILGLPTPVLPGELADDVRRIAAGLAALTQAGRALIDCGDGAAPFHILFALAAFQPGRETRFHGSARLAERPHEALFETLGLLGARVDAPWHVVGARPTRERAPVDTRTSSQYASALVIAACHAAHRWGQTLTLDLEGPTVSRGYLELTLRWAREAGFAIEDRGDSIHVQRGATPATLPAIPPDWSSLGYLLLMAHASGSEVTVGSAAEHPDRAVLGQLAACGLRVDDRNGRLSVSGRVEAPLDLRVSTAPDLAPTLGALALAGTGTSTFREAHVLRNKESDRLAGLLELAAAVGATAHLDSDTLRITATPHRPEVFHFDCRNDHRLTFSAVSLACLLRCRAELTRTAGTDKSFPGFFHQAARCGVRAG